MAEWLARGLWHYGSRYSRKSNPTEEELTAGLEDFAAKVRLWAQFTDTQVPRNPGIRPAYDWRSGRQGRPVGVYFRTAPWSAFKRNIPDLSSIRPYKRYSRSRGYFRPIYAQSLRRRVYRPRYKTKRRRWRRRR